MKAVVFGDGRAVALAERHEPEPGPGEAMVRSEYCGICGTDLHAARLEGLFVPGVVMGHEFAGQVLALGPDVSGWQPGERVTISPNGDVCGACRECRSGRTNLCRARKTGSVGVKRDGGMAPYVSIPVAVLHRLPDGVTTRQGAWVEPLAVALRVVRVAEFRVGGSAVVLGAGPIGLLTLQVLRRAGASHIAVVEPSSLRRETATRLGADLTIDPRSEDPHELFGGHLPAPDYVFECAGIPTGVATAAAIVRPGGCVVVVGLCAEPLDLNFRELITKEIVVRGSHTYVEEFPLAIRLMEQRAIDIDALTTEVMPLQSYKKAFRLMGGSEGAVKVLLKP